MLNYIFGLSHKTFMVTVVFAIALNILFAFMVADFVGSKRVIGFAATLIISIVASPVIGLIAALLSKTKEQQELEINFYKNDKTISVADEISKLKDLKEQGVITPDDFEQQKQKLLSK